MTAQPNQIVVSNYDRIKAVMTAKENIHQFALALGVPQRQAVGFIQSALIAVMNNNALMNCTPISIITSTLRAASLGLTCDPEFGHAWLVPFNDYRNNQMVCTFQAGYKGYIHLAERTNKYRYIHTGEIYDGQIIEQDQLTGKTRILGTRKSRDAKVVGYFNHFEMLNGFSHTLYMTVEECQEHGRRYSPSYDDVKGKWQKDFESMAKKTVTKLNLKHYGYFSPNDRQFLEDDDRPDGGEIVVDAQFTDDVPAPEPVKRTEAEITQELTGENAEAATAPKLKEWTNTKVTRETAETAKTSQGDLYWALDDATLAQRYNGCKKGLEKDGLTQEQIDGYHLRMDIIQSILDWRK